jgi:hypothetical protein
VICRALRLGQHRASRGMSGVPYRLPHGGAR